MKLIHTERCKLVPLRVEHATAMFPLLSDPRIYEFLLHSPPATLELLRERYLRHEKRRSPDGSQQWLNWIIQPLDSEECLGFIQSTLYTPETGDFAFVLGPAYWGRGFAHEASVAALSALFIDYAVSSLFAVAEPRNARSVALLARLGFCRIENKEYPHGDILPSDHAFRLDRSA